MQRTIDYLTGSPALIPKLKAFTIYGRSIGLAVDHSYLRFKVKDGCIRYVYSKERGLAEYGSTRKIVDVYSCGLYNDMLNLDNFVTLDEVTQ